MANDALIRQRLFQIRAAVNAIETLLGAPEAPAEAVKRAERALPEVFEEFWGLYPKKVGKMAAFKAWKANVVDSMPVAVMEALKKQLGQIDWVKEGGKYIPHPATWLNQHRWLDEIKGGGDNGSGKYGGLGETL